MDYLLHVFGVFLGVVGGVATILTANCINEKRKESQKVRNLKYELELNIDKVDKWLEEITKYRNAVNGDNLVNYFGYFDLSRFISVTANNLFQMGLLYKYLDRDSIGKLQIIYSEFSLSGENYLNNQIIQNKTKAANQIIQLHVKRDVITTIDFWEDKFKEHKKTLESVLEKLK
jgi:hypothetical protein